MAVIFRLYDEAGRLVVGEGDLVFRVLGTQKVVGYTGPDMDFGGSTGTIVHPGFLSGQPFCETIPCGTGNDGATVINDDLPAPVISISGDTLSYSQLAGDWILTYGVC